VCPMLRYTRGLKAKPKRLPLSFWGWVLPVYRTSEEEMLKVAGFDAATYMRIIAFGEYWSDTLAACHQFLCSQTCYHLCSLPLSRRNRIFLDAHHSVLRYHLASQPCGKALDTTDPASDHPLRPATISLPVRIPLCCCGTAGLMHSSCHEGQEGGQLHGQTTAPQQLHILDPSTTAHQCACTPFSRRLICHRARCMLPTPLPYSLTNATMIVVTEIVMMTDRA
jgi:hypothetical protein